MNETQERVQKDPDNSTAILVIIVLIIVLIGVLAYFQNAPEFNGDRTPSTTTPVQGR